MVAPLGRTNAFSNERGKRGLTNNSAPLGRAGWPFPTGQWPRTKQTQPAFSTKVLGGRVIGPWRKSFSEVTLGGGESPETWTWVPAQTLHRGGTSSKSFAGSESRYLSHPESCCWAFPVEVTVRSVASSERVRISTRSGGEAHARDNHTARGKNRRLPAPRRLQRS